MDEILFDEPAAGVRRITLNRPDKLNSFTYAMYAALIAELDAVRLRPDIRVVVLTGAGRGVCAGHDIAGGGGAPAFVPDGLGPMQMKTLVNAEIARIPALMHALPQPAQGVVQPTGWDALDHRWRTRHVCRRGFDGRGGQGVLHEAKPLRDHPATMAVDTGQQFARHMLQLHGDRPGARHRQGHAGETPRCGDGG